MTARVEGASTWLVAHAARVWGLLVIVAVLAASWGALRGIHIHEVRATLRALDGRWLIAAAVFSLFNIATMGAYDVIAFRHTRTTPAERWRYGAVAFCWSNFLTLGPLAGPAIRLWLYRETARDTSELHAGILSVAVAFVSGLAGWTLAAFAGSRAGTGPAALAVVALALVAAAVWIARTIARRFDRFAGDATAVWILALVGWVDWLLAMAAFASCVYATGARTPAMMVAEQFFFGQAVGLVSLIPAGLGSSDAFWIAHLPIAQSASAAALAVYRFIYYVAPWFTASLLLLAWATHASPRRTALARRVIAALVGGAGVLITISSASPALHARLLLLERFVPLPLVEAGQMAAAFAGLLLLALARGLARGYRAAYRGTLALLLLAGLASLLKGLDWEESVTLATVGVAAWSQAALFQRESSGDWIETTDLGLAFTALMLFVTYGIFSHHLGAGVLDRWRAIGYHVQGARFVRTAASMLLAVGAATLYVLVRTPVHFQAPADAEIDRALQFNAAHGTGTTPIMAAVGDKSIFFDAEQRGFCLYRTIGPYLTVFSDPVVRLPAERGGFLDALFAFAGEIDRRVLFYQISPDWIPLVHDRGYHLFKLGEEAIVPLERITLHGHAGKMPRQFLRRAERDGLVFRVVEPGEVASRMPELETISTQWLRVKQITERQFSIGYFEPHYLARFRCAVVETRDGSQLLAFANLLEGPHRQELSVDLMRYRTDGPNVMDFLITSVMLHARDEGYRTFNLGMAPLASVGERREAHRRERLASLIFRRGEQWYNFQGVRQFKQKFDPEWLPRYMAYEAAWEWPVALANVSALIAGGWRPMVAPGRESRRA